MDLSPDDIEELARICASEARRCREYAEKQRTVRRNEFIDRAARLDVLAERLAEELRRPAELAL